MPWGLFRGQGRGLCNKGALWIGSALGRRSSRAAPSMTPFFPRLDDQDAQRQWLAGFGAAWVECPEAAATAAILGGDWRGGESVEDALMRALATPPELLRQLWPHRDNARPNLTGVPSHGITAPDLKQGVEPSLILPPRSAVGRYPGFQLGEPRCRPPQRRQTGLVHVGEVTVADLAFALAVFERGIEHTTRLRGCGQAAKHRR